ncbi:transmembrane protein 218 [Protopterus annectens]|uniref:transmembrane protein 218 n=1 Tax=Protopterus annectens TaxID=7888 RepID=UPI001CFB8268|nr:transmembrane protein 218 [Protopterus annectens]
MANIVLGVGSGIFVIAVVWIAALVLCALLFKASGPARFLGILAVLCALIITLVLVFFPRTSQSSTTVTEAVIVDTFFIGRYFLLSVLGVIFLVSLLLVLTQHSLEPIYARPVRPH